MTVATDACDVCDSQKIRIKKSSGGITSGQFTERYVCDGCGATGRIIGRAEQAPAQWSYRGRIFNG
jgi:hypothetical protein